MRSLYFLIIALFAVSFITEAQNWGGMMGRMGEDRPALERLESYKKLRMVEDLKLNEEQSMKLLSRYNKHREVVKGFEHDRKELLEKLEQNVSSNASDNEFNKTFTELIDIEKKIFGAREKYLSELKEVLTNKQIAEYLLFERNFARDIREMVRDVQRQKNRN
jgi:hypothetical protein